MWTQNRGSDTTFPTFTHIYITGEVKCLPCVEFSALFRSVLKLGFLTGESSAYFNTKGEFNV